MRLSKLGEFGAIERIKGICRPAGRGVVVGIGDDAAVLKVPHGGMTLVSTDMLVEGVHFDLSYTPMGALGFKALTVNVSDIAAMGGRTRYYLTSIALSPDFKTEDLDSLYKGMEEAAGRFGSRMVGGDTCASTGPMVICVTVLGEPAGVKPVRRSGARPGDDIYVSGTLGESAGGLLLLKAGAGGGKQRDKGVDKSAARLMERHLMPVPRAELGAELGRAGLATSMIDISDGFSSDLMHILQTSGVGAEVEGARLPVSRGLEGVFGRKKAAALALHGGEDYELLFTAGRLKRKAIEGMGGCVRVGRVTEGGGAWLIGEDGRRVSITPKGYEHFRK
jgi:thiamine-monophosphate kinase